MAKVKVGSVIRQASSTALKTSIMDGDYHNVLSDLSSLSSNDALVGEAYESARNYIKRTFRPAVEAAITAGQELRKATRKLQSGYISKVDFKSWSDRELEEKIKALEHQVSNLTSEMNAANNGNSVTGNTCQGYGLMIGSANFQLHHLRTIKRHLDEFSKESEKYFSGLSSVLSAIKQASNDLRTVNSFDSKRRRFKNGKKKSWAKNIDELYARRQKEKGESTLDAFGEVFDADHVRAKFFESVGTVVRKVSPKTGDLFYYFGKSLDNERGFARTFPYISAVIGLASFMQKGDSLKVASEKVISDAVVDKVIIDVPLDAIIDTPIVASDEFAGLTSDPVDLGAGTAVGTAAAITMSIKADEIVNNEVNKVIDKLNGKGK